MTGPGGTARNRRPGPQHTKACRLLTGECMHFWRPAIIVLLFAAAAFAEVTPGQKATWADLKDYHKDIASFEALAARAVREGPPDSLITMGRFFYYLQHGEIAPLRVMLTQLEKSRDDVLSQQIEPTTAAQFEKVLEVARKLIEATDKNPAKAATLLAAANRFAQAQTHLRDLRIIDSAIDQYAIEHNKRPGDAIPPEALLQYLPKNQRLWRTGADCLGNPYGPQFVDQPPKLSRVSYERIAESVPKDYFKPFVVAEK